jgi:hypothetical protein
MATAIREDSHILTGTIATLPGMKREVWNSFAYSFFDIASAFWFCCRDEPTVLTVAMTLHARHWLWSPQRVVAVVTRPISIGSRKILDQPVASLNVVIANATGAKRLDHITVSAGLFVGRTYIGVDQTEWPT